MPEITQLSNGDQLLKLTVSGSADELWELAGLLVRAMDQGNAKAIIGPTQVKIQRADCNQE